MFGLSFSKWKWILGLLFLANIINYLYSNWGLVTVKVTNAPLSKVISSIEWQGWVKIYTNLPPDSKVTMFVDHVPLAEAMETLAANVDLPPPSADDEGGGRPNRDRPRGFSPGGGQAGGGPPEGGPGRPPGGRGVGFGRAAQWNLAFFVAPTSSEVKQEIRQFETDDPGNDSKIYTYGTQMQVIANEAITTTPDPRLQSWPGMKPVDASQPGPAAPSTTSASSDASAVAPTSEAESPLSPSTASPTAQTYLQAFAAAANIWIMAPATWAPGMSSAPAPNSSIIRAVENFVTGSHGAVTQAIILRAGAGGQRGDFAGGDDGWEDRMRNAINGLPTAERPDALDQLNQEVQFRKELQTLPPEQRRQKFIQHFLERMIYGERLSRLSPEKRAKIYHRMIVMRTAAKAPK